MGEGRDLLERDLTTSTQEYIRSCIDAAVTVGSDVVAGPVNTPTGKTWRMDDADRAAAEPLVYGPRPLADYADKPGIRLTIEPLNCFKTNFLNTAAQTMEVFERVGSSALGVRLDSFHMHIEEKDQAAAIHRVADKFVHFHACGNDRGAPGVDHIPWESITSALREIGYEGAVVMSPSLLTTSYRPCGRHLAPAGRGDGLAFLREAFAWANLGTSPVD